MTKFRYFLDLHMSGEAEEFGGVLKFFEGKSGDGKNF